MVVQEVLVVWVLLERMEESHLCALVSSQGLCRVISALILILNSIKDVSVRSVNTLSHGIQLGVVIKQKRLQRVHILEQAAGPGHIERGEILRRSLNGSLLLGWIKVLDPSSLLIKEELVEFLSYVLESDLFIHLFSKLLHGSLAIIVVVEIVEHEVGASRNLRIQISVEVGR